MRQILFALTICCCFGSMGCLSEMLRDDGRLTRTAVSPRGQAVEDAVDWGHSL